MFCLYRYLCDVSYWLGEIKIDTSNWFYDPYNHYHFPYTDGALSIYDENYELLYKEPALRNIEDLHVVNKELSVFTLRSSNSVVFYNFLRREKISAYRLRLPHQFGKTLGIRYPLYCRTKNTIIFVAWHKDESDKNLYSIFSYNIDTKIYTQKYKLNNIFVENFACDNKYYYIITKENAKVFLVFDEDLNHNIVPFDNRYEKISNKMRIEKKSDWNEAFDFHNGVLCNYHSRYAFDGQTFFVTDTNESFDDCFAVNLNGQIIPWKPARVALKKDVKEKKLSHSIDIRKTGITKEVLENCSDEDIINEGYFWSLDRLEEKAKANGIKIQDFIGDVRISEIENVLYSIGWFITELNEGGVGQYFLNGSQFEFDFLIKALAIIGAVETVGLIKKCIKVKEKFDKNENRTEKDFESFAEEMELLEQKNAEDYLALAVKYLKKH